MAPLIFKWVMLKINMEIAIQENQSVGIVYPVALGGEMQLGAMAHRYEI